MHSNVTFIDNDFPKFQKVFIRIQRKVFVWHICTHITCNLLYPGHMYTQRIDLTKSWWYILSIYISIYLSIYQSIYLIYLSIYQSIYSSKILEKLYIMYTLYIWDMCRLPEQTIVFSLLHCPYTQYGPFGALQVCKKNPKF